MQARVYSLLETSVTGQQETRENIPSSALPPSSYVLQRQSDLSTESRYVESYLILEADSLGFEELNFN